MTRTKSMDIPMMALFLAAFTTSTNATNPQTVTTAPPNMCNAVRTAGGLSPTQPTGVCFSAGVGSTRFVCKGPTTIAWETSQQSDCSAPTVNEMSTSSAGIIPSLLAGSTCGLNDCYATFSGHTTQDCTGTALQVGLYTGGEDCQSGRRYYCDSQGLYVYLYALDNAILSCFLNYGRLLLHNTGCVALNLSAISPAIPNTISSIQFGQCVSSNPPPGTFPLQLSYHLPGVACSGQRVISFQMPLDAIGCLGDVQFFCGNGVFWKYTYANSGCLGAITEALGKPTGCLDFTPSFVDGFNFGSASIGCTPGGLPPPPIAFGAAVEASRALVYASPGCTGTVEREAFIAVGCRPILSSTDALPTTSNFVSKASGLPIPPSGPFMKISCTATGFQIESPYSDSSCLVRQLGATFVTQTPGFGICIDLPKKNPTDTTMYATVSACEVNLPEYTPPAAAASGGSGAAATVTGAGPTGFTGVMATMMVLSVLSVGVVAGLELTAPTK